MKIFPRISVFLNLIEANVAWIHNQSPVLSRVVRDRDHGLCGVPWDGSIQSLPNNGELVIVSLSPAMMRDEHVWRLVAATCMRLGHLCIARDQVACARGNHLIGEDYIEAVNVFLNAYEAHHLQAVTERSR